MWVATRRYTVHYCYVVPYYACVYDSRLLFNSQQYPQTRSGWENSDVFPTTRVLPRERYFLHYMQLFPHIPYHLPPYTHMFYTRSQLGVPLRGGRYDPASADGSAWSTWRGREDGGRGRYTSGYGEGGTAEKQVRTPYEIRRRKLVMSDHNEIITRLLHENTCSFCASDLVMIFQTTSIVFALPLMLIFISLLPTCNTAVM